MTVHKDLKRIIRERQGKTGESYTTARGHVVRERAALGGAEPDALETQEPVRVDAVVLKVNQGSARVRILGVPFGSGEIATGELFSAQRRANLARFLGEEVMPEPLRASGFNWRGFADWAGGILADRGWSATLATL